MYVIPKAALADALVAYRTAVLNGGAIGLFINNIVPDGSTVIGDFTEPGAEWPGYARVTTATWGPVYTDIDGRAVCEDMVHFPGPTSGAGDIVFGWFGVDAGGVLWGSGTFDEGQQDATIVGGGLTFVLSSFGLLGGQEVVILD